MSFATDKAALLEIIKAHDCTSVDWVDQNLTSYDDIIPVFILFVTKFDCQPNYMYSLFDCFADSELLSRGIYYNKPSAGDLSGAKLLIKSNAGAIALSVAAGDLYGEFVIAGASTVDSLTITGGGNIGCISLSAGAVLKSLDTDTGSTINVVRISACRNYASKLLAANSAANITRIYIDPGGYFGGYNCIDPTGTCASEVTGLATEKLTDKSVIIRWGIPVDSIDVIVYYRLNNTSEWLLANANNSNGITTEYTTDGIGVVIRGLEPNTYYDVKAQNVCSNGIISAGSQLTFKTAAINEGGSSSDTGFWTNRADLLVGVDIEANTVESGAVPVHLLPGPKYFDLSVKELLSVEYNSAPVQDTPVNPVEKTIDFSSIGGIYSGVVKILYRNKF